MSQQAPVLEKIKSLDKTEKTTLRNLLLAAKEGKDTMHMDWDIPAIKSLADKRLLYFFDFGRLEGFGHVDFEPEGKSVAEELIRQENSSLRHRLRVSVRKILRV